MPNIHNRFDRKNFAASACTVVALLASLSPTATAQTRTPIPAPQPYYGYLYIPGVYGAAASPYTNWHDVRSYAIEARKVVSGGRAYGSTLSPLTVGTDLGLALPQLTVSCASVRRFRYVILRMFRSGESRYFAEYRLYDARVTKVATRGAGQSIEFDYNRVVFTQVDTTTGTRRSRTLDRGTTGATTGKSLPVQLAGSDDDYEVLVRVDGIPGRATRAGYSGWHAMHGFEVGVRAPVSSSTLRTATTPRFDPFAVTARLGALPEFATAAVTGQQIQNVEIHVFHKGITRGPVLVVTLGEVLVCNATGEGDSQTVKFDYGRIQYESYQGGRGSGLRVTRGGWNLRTNTAL